MRKNKGITLIALVITIIVLLILAGVAIATISGNSSIIENSNKAAEAYNTTANEDEALLGKLENKLKEYTGVENNTPTTPEEPETPPKDDTPEEQTPIGKTTSCVRYYADITGDGEIDGVIYADLAIGGSGQWGNSDGNYTIPQEKDTTKLKDYYVSMESYTTEEFGTYPVLTPVNGNGTNKKDRFYIMSLKDIDRETHYWYNTAYGKMDDYESYTLTAFGEGSRNTEKMITKWNAEGYGKQNANDLWGLIQTEVNNGWFVPSKEEWSAFAGELGIDSSNYSDKFGLRGLYWSSSQYSAKRVWSPDFDYGYMSDDSLLYDDSVRLSATF